MNLSNHMTCPACGSSSFTAKYEATYEYSYTLDFDAPGLKNHDEFLSFLFDNRELTNAKQYVECRECNAQYPCFFTREDEGIGFTIIQKAIRSDHASMPQFLG